MIPAELGIAVLAGGAMLLVAALVARRRRWLVGGVAGATLACIVLCMALAALTGLASGRTEPTGWRFVLVVSMLALYDIGVVALGVAGIVLAIDLLNARSRVATATPNP